MYISYNKQHEIYMTGRNILPLDQRCQTHLFGRPHESVVIDRRLMFNFKQKTSRF